MDEVVDLIVDSLSEFHKTLTPGQKEKLVAKIDKLVKSQFSRSDVIPAKAGIQ